MLLDRRSLDVRLSVAVLMYCGILIATPDTLPIGFHCGMITVLILLVVSVIVCW